MCVFGGGRRGGRGGHAIVGEPGCSPHLRYLLLQALGLGSPFRGHAIRGAPHHVVAAAVRQPDDVPHPACRTPPPAITPAPQQNSHGLHACLKGATAAPMHIIERQCEPCSVPRNGSRHCMGDRGYLDRSHALRVIGG